MDGRDIERDLEVMLPVVDGNTHPKGLELVQTEADGKDLDREYLQEDPDTIVTEIGQLQDHV